MRQLLRVDGLPALRGLPSTTRMAAGTDTLGFFSYPLLFYTSFPGVSLSQLRSLSTAGSYLFDHVLCLDDLLDRQSEDHDGTVLQGDELYREALTRLAALFPPDSPFWTHVDRYHAHFTQAVLRESMRHRHILRPYPTPELELIYSGKAAVAKMCLAALAVLGDDTGSLTALEASHDAFYVGFQLADDLDDWRIDYERAHYTYPLSVALLRAGWRERVESRNRPTAVEVGELLDTSGVAEETRALAMTYLDRAGQTVATMPKGSWFAAIQDTRDRVRRGRFGTTGASGETTVDINATGDQDDGAALSLATEDAVTVAPVAPGWRAWLDPEREPRVVVDDVLARQHRVLRAARDVRTVGAALCHVGLAVHASLAAVPEAPLDLHLGVSAGELDWFRRHDTALDAMLAEVIDDYPELWHQGERPTTGWIPPAVGRYLGYRLIADCRDVLPRGQSDGVTAALAHYRRRSVA
nr:hypothetical protein AUK03_00835 [uncultured bacterium]AXL05627.1 hypothetical protein AUK03_00835 [uncultured bacterium]